MRKWIALDVAERYIEALRVLADVVPDPAEVESTTRDVDDDYLVALARCRMGEVSSSPPSTLWSC